MEALDAVIIGAGPAGYFCAIRLAQLKQKVAIVDRQWLGGVCLNIGCIPSKVLLRNAEVALLLRTRAQDFGFAFDNLRLDFPAAVRRSRQVAERLTRGVSFLMKKNQVEVFMGAASVASAPSTAPGLVTVTGSDGSISELRAKNIILATGARPAVPAAWKVDGEKVVTYREAILQERLPKSVAIIGSGAIGVEFATLWNSYGVEVTMLEMLPRLVPLEDEEVGEELARAFLKRGIHIRTGHRVEALEVSSDTVKLTVSSAGGKNVLEAEQVLIAVGFTPNTQGLGLEQQGVRLARNGCIEISEDMATSVPGLWAIGDVTGKLMLAHAGSAQGVVCAEAVAGLKPAALDYEAMPRVTYCQPQIASFGLSEAQVRERGYIYETGRFPFQANGKALGLGDYGGWVKLLVDKKNRRILGAHLIGADVAELLPELTLAHRMEATPAEIAGNIHAHPTLSEALMEAALAVEGKAINI